MMLLVRYIPDKRDGIAYQLSGADGAVFPPEGVRGELQFLHVADGRSVCDSPQPQASSVCVPSSQSPGMEGRCVVHPLGSS